MAAVGLGEFIAHIQDGLQRSYDFIEDVAEAGRDGRGEGVMLTVGEVSLSIPVAWSTRTRTVDLSGLLKPERASTPFELTRTLLTAPMADPELRKVLREQAYTAIARQRIPPAEAEEEEEEGERETATARLAGATERVGRPPLAISLPEQARQVVRRTTKSGRVAEPELALTVLGEGAARMDSRLAGRLEIRFKPVVD